MLGELLLLDQPHLQVFVQQHVEAEDLKSVRIVGDVFLTRAQRLQHTVLDFVPDARIWAHGAIQISRFSF